MTAQTRTYGEFCGVARAMELVGGRWALLIVRDLVLGSKRYTELQAGLPKIPPSILSARLNELEKSRGRPPARATRPGRERGVRAHRVRQRAGPRPAGPRVVGSALAERP